MKPAPIRYASSSIGALAAFTLALVSCGPSTTPTTNNPPAASPSRDDEVERRVQAELARQLQAEADRLAPDARRAQDEREIEARVQARLAEERERRAPTATPAPSAAPRPAVAARATEPLDDEDDDDDGGPSAPAPRRPSARAMDPQAYRLFYEKLSRSGDGDWLETDRYGFVFQPRAAAEDRSWRPYTDGNWARTEAAGWTWVSNEPFGWAAYHYGRWARLQNVGWVWVPGTTWGPGYVSWRVSADRKQVGWAPLPPEARVSSQQRRGGRGANEEGFGRWVDRAYDIGPENYTFISTSDFGETTYRRHVLPPERNLEIIDRSENVTHTSIREVENRTVIINDGPDFALLRRESRQPVRELRLERRDEPAEYFLRQGPSGGSAPPRGITEVQGDRLVVAVAPAAEIASAVIGALRPPQVKRKVENAPVDRGYEGLRDPGAAERMRAKMRAESPPPPPELARRAAAAIAPRENQAPPPPPPTAAPRTPPPIPPPTAVPSPKPERKVPPAATPPPAKISPPAVTTPPAPPPQPPTSAATPPVAAVPPRTEAERAAHRAEKEAERARQAATPPTVPSVAPAAPPRPVAAQPSATPNAEREAAKAQRRAEREHAAGSAVPPAAPVTEQANPRPERPRTPAADKNDNARPEPGRPRPVGVPPSGGQPATPAKPSPTPIPPG